MPTPTRVHLALRTLMVPITVAGLVIAGSGTSAAEPTAPRSGSEAQCPALHLVVVPGTTEIDQNSSPDLDTGFFSRLTVPAVQEANTTGKATLERTYVPYAASFGGKPGDKSTLPYAQSVESGVESAQRIIGDIAARCPGTKVFLSGYSQGAEVASKVTREIGAGDGPIAPEKFAGGALFSDPTRSQGEEVLGGARSPAPAPGTSGAAVSAVQLASTSAAEAPSGGGIAPTPSITDFGAVADRVASFCTHGDLACDTPADAPAAKLVAAIAGQSSMDTRDPVRILGDVATAVGRTALLTAASVVNDNVDFDSNLGQFEVKQAPETILSKMARYADPTAVSGDQAITEAVNAVTKIAGMAIGAAITVARDVITPETIGQLATVGLANPPAALGLLAAKIGQAAVKLVPPATIDSAVNVAFDEVTRTVDENKGLAKLVTDTSYWNTAVKHGSYDTVPVGSHGETPVELTVRWLVALAADITGDSSLAEKVGAVVKQTSQLFSTTDVVQSATSILDARSSATGSTSAPVVTPTR